MDPASTNLTEQVGVLTIGDVETHSDASFNTIFTGDRWSIPMDFTRSKDPLQQVSIELLTPVNSQFDEINAATGSLEPLCRDQDLTKIHPIQSARDKANAARRVETDRIKQMERHQKRVQKIKGEPKIGRKLTERQRYLNRLASNITAAKARRKADEVYRDELCESLAHMETEINRLRAMKAFLDDVRDEDIFEEGSSNAYTKAA